MEQKTCKILQSTHKKYALHELNWNLSRQSIRWCNTWTFWFRQCPAGQRCNDEGNCLHFLGSQGEAWCKSSVTQGPLPSWINKCMSNLQSLQYLQWTLKDAPWRLWRVSHPILSLIGLSRGEDQKLPTSLLRKGCKFCCNKHGITSLIVQQLSFQRWDKWHFLELCHKGQPEVWRICSGPTYHKFQQFPGLGMSITRLYVDTP